MSNMVGSFTQTSEVRDGTTQASILNTFNSSGVAPTPRTGKSTSVWSSIWSVVDYTVLVNVTAIGDLLNQTKTYFDKEAPQPNGTANTTSVQPTTLTRSQSQGSQTSISKTDQSHSVSPGSSIGAYPSSDEDSTAKTSVFGMEIRRRLSSAKGKLSSGFSRRKKAEGSTFASTCRGAAWTGASYVASTAYSALTFVPSVAKAVVGAYWDAAWSCWPGTAESQTGRTGTEQSQTGTEAGSQPSVAPPTSTKQGTAAEVSTGTSGSVPVQRYPDGFWERQSGRSGVHTQKGHSNALASALGKYTGCVGGTRLAVSRHLR